MKTVYLAIIVIIILVYFLVTSSKKEGFHLNPVPVPDFTMQPFNVPVYPFNVGTGRTFPNVKVLCPDATGVKCKTKEDCPGAAQLCMNSAGYPSDGTEDPANYCVCSIMNDCISEGVC